MRAFVWISVIGFTLAMIALYQGTHWLLGPHGGSLVAFLWGLILGIMQERAKKTPPRPARCAMMGIATERRKSV